MAFGKNFEVFINLLPCYSKTINGSTKGYKRKIRRYYVHTYHDLGAWPLSEHTMRNDEERHKIDLL